MRGTMQCAVRSASWYVIVPPPIELGPCLIAYPYSAKRSSQSSILSAASVRRKDISISPALSDSACSDDKTSISALDNQDDTDVYQLISMSDEGNEGSNEDVNGNEHFQVPPARHVSEYTDSGLVDSMDFTGEISQEELLERGELEDGDVSLLSSNEINICVPHSEGDGDTSGGTDQGIMGGLQVGDRVRNQDAVQEAIAKVSAECISGNLSVSLSQHSMEVSSSSERLHSNEPSEIRPEMIISPLRSESDSVQLSRADSLHKKSLGDRTRDVQISDKINIVEGHKSLRISDAAQTTQDLSGHLMEDTTQPTLSEHPIDTSQSTVELSLHLSRHNLELSQADNLDKGTLVERTKNGQIPDKVYHVKGRESPRIPDSSQTSQDLSEQLMEDTTQPTLSEHPIDDSSQGTIELSEYPMETRTSLDLPAREEPLGQHTLVDSNENIIGTDSESYTSTSAHSENASTIIHARIQGETISTSVNTNQSLSTPSSSLSSNRSGGIRSADNLSHRSYDETVSSRGKYIDKSLDYVSSDRKISCTTSASGDSLAGNISEDSIGPHMNSDQNNRLRGSQVKLPLDTNTLRPMSAARHDTVEQTTELARQHNCQEYRKQDMDSIPRIDNDQTSDDKRGFQDSREQIYNGMSTKPGASYIQYPHSLQSRSSSEISRSKVSSRASTVSMESSKKAASSQGGFRIHGVEGRGLSPKVSPEGAEASDDGRNRATLQNRTTTPLPSSAISTSQASNVGAYLNLDDLQTQDTLADRVALLLGDAIVTSLSRDRPGVGDGGSSSEAGTPDSIETESEKALLARDQVQDDPGFAQRLPTGNQELANSARSGTTISSYTDSLADRVAQILAESDAIKQIQAYQASAGGRLSPTPSDVSTSSSVRAIIDKVLQRTATGVGYVSGDDTSSQCSDIPPHVPGGYGFETDNRQSTSPRHSSLSKSMSVPLGSPYSPESVRRTISPTAYMYRDGNMQSNSRQGASVASYQTTDTLDRQVQYLLAHTAYVDQHSVSPTYSPGRESPRLVLGRQSPITTTRMTTFDRIRQGEIPLRRHSITGIPHPSYPSPTRADTICRGDQHFYLRMEPEGKSSLGKRSGQASGGYTSHIPVAAATGRDSPSDGYTYRRTPDRRSTDITQTSEAHSPRGQYVDSPESTDSLAFRVQAILAADQHGERADMIQETQLNTGEFPLPEGSLQAAWQARVAAGQQQMSPSSRTSMQSTPYSSRHESPRVSHHGSPRAGSPRGFAPPVDHSLYVDTHDDVEISEYGAFDRARNLLSNQLHRATDMTFDHSLDVQDTFVNRIAGRPKPRRTGNVPDQYAHSGIPIPRSVNQVPTSPRGSPLMSPRLHPPSPRGSPLMSPRMHPTFGVGSGRFKEAWRDDFQNQDDFQPAYYGSLPDQESPAVPDDKDSGHFYPLQPQFSPAVAFVPVPGDYSSLPRSFAKSPMRYHPQSLLTDNSVPFGTLPRSVSSPNIDIIPPRSRIYTRQISDRVPRGDRGERDPAHVKYKTWETDAREAKARMSPCSSPSSPREYRQSRSLSRENEQLSRSLDHHRMSPRSMGILTLKPDEYAHHGAHPSKVISPRGNDTYGATTIRAYRPPGSADVQYTYPVAMEEGSITSNQTTMESSHPGSDDAVPPAFPPGALGSRRSMSPLHSPHGLSRIPRYGRASPQLDQATDRMKGAFETERSKSGARSYMEYQSAEASTPDGLPKSPESQHRSRTDAGDRYQDKTVRFPGGPAETSPSHSGVHMLDRPQSPRTSYSGIPVRHDDGGTRVSANVEYAGVVRDLPPVHPSSYGYRRASDSSLRSHQHSGSASRFGQQGSDVPLPPGNYSRAVLQDVIQNESNPRYAEMGNTWEEYERFRAATEGVSRSSLDSDRICQVADLLEDPVKHTVTKWAKLDDADTQSESSYDSRRRRKRWEKEQPFKPAQLNSSFDKAQVAVSRQTKSVDQSTLDTTLAPPSSLSDEEEPVKHPKKPETGHRRLHSDPCSLLQETGGEHSGFTVQSVPDKEKSPMQEESSLSSVDTLLSDMSLESDQLYRLLGAQGVRKLSSKLVKLQNKIDRQKEHQRKREERSVKADKKGGAPKMASTPSQQAPSVDNSMLQKVADTVQGKGEVSCTSGHTLSPVAERIQETMELPSQITNASTLLEDPTIIVNTGETIVKCRREYRLTEHQLKKLERRRKHKHVNYKDDFHVSYGSESPSETISDGSIPCTCRPRRARSLQDIAAKSRSTATVTIEPKSHSIRKGTFKKPTVKPSRLPSRIPVHSAEDVQTRDASTNYPSPAIQKTTETHRASKGTAFVITFPADKQKGKNGTVGKEQGVHDEGENGTRPKRLQYKWRGTVDGDGPGAGKLEPVAWFQPFNKKMPWQQQDPPRKPLTDTQPPALKREGTKTMVKLTLQEALEEKRADFISRSRERQKKVQLAAEERQTQLHYEMERDRLFQDKRPSKSNTQAHPYSDQLHKPKKRNLSQKEIKEQTKRLYRQLPEVVKRNETEKRLQTYQTNRIKAQVYRKKLSDRIKGKAWSET